MTELAGFPYFELQVDKDGKVVDANARKQAVDFLAQGTTTDLFVMSHGWNNDMDDARALYANFFASVRQLLKDGAPPDVLQRKFAVLAILWPSKKFTDEQLIPGGAASAASPISTAVLQKKLDGLKGVFDNVQADTLLAEARQLVPQLATSPAAQEKFADLVRSLPGTRAGNTEDASDRFFALAGREAMDRLAKPVMPAAKPTSGGAASMGSASGGAAGIGSFFSGINSAALNLLNYTTYYQMKERAGLVGRTAVSDVVREIAARAPDLKLHLIGHSFGARLVTSLALGPDGQPAQKFASMTLLQAAFSHNGFAQKFDGNTDGFFRRVVSEGRVAGPVLITFTINDKAVGLAYPLASLLAGQKAAAIGDAKDPFGGLGRNGAQHTPEADALTLAAVGAPNAFAAGRIHNLNADKVISNHSDICKPEVAYALLSAVART